MVCAIAFFVHEFIPGESNELTIATKNYKAAKAKRTKTLNNLKKNSEGTELYKLYLKEKENTDLLWNQYLKQIKEEEFRGFKNIQQFLGEFGWALGLFIYTLFNINLLFIRRKLVYPELLFHTVIMAISMYFINWALQHQQDYSKTTYLLFSILITILITLAVYYYHLLKRKKYLNLQNRVRKLFDFIIIKSADKYVRDEDKKEYIKDCIELTKDIKNEKD